MASPGSIAGVHGSKLRIPAEAGHGLDRMHTSSFEPEYALKQQQTRCDQLLAKIEAITPWSVLEQTVVQLPPSPSPGGFRLRVTTNLAFGEWGAVFGDARKSTALLDRLSQHCHILETGNESYRFRHSSATAKSRIQAWERGRETTESFWWRPRWEIRYGLRPPRLPQYKPSSICRLQQRSKRENPG